MNIRLVYFHFHKKSKAVYCKQLHFQKVNDLPQTWLSATKSLTRTTLARKKEYIWNPAISAALVCLCIKYTILKAPSSQHQLVIPKNFFRLLNFV